MAREYWTPDQWSGWQEERLGRLLRQASTNVAYYRRRWDEVGRNPDRPRLTRLADWPVLRKEQVRADPPAFVASGRKSRLTAREHTSGTTGTPISLWVGRNDARLWYALFEARVRRWNGVDRADRWAMLGGQLVVSPAQARPPFWVWNAGMRQLYMSSYHLSPATAAMYVAAMRQHDVSYLLGYPSAMSTLAAFALEQGLKTPVLRVAIGNAEPLLLWQRAAISAAFRCPVRETYGMAEIVCGASECSAGSLHLWPEAGVVEVLADDADREVSPGHSGRLVATGLLNETMPLIRYELGDRGSFDGAGDPCGCGRTLPRLLSVEGRTDDVLVTPDGRRVGRLDPVFKADLPIREAQVIQETIDRIRVRVVAAEGFDERHAREIRLRLRDRLGSDVQIAVETTDCIPRGSRGKFQAVVSKLNVGTDETWT
jgi:phenylacetate-coenzyme A ligase PaaK-like adenylate-forming protein